MVIPFSRQSMNKIPCASQNMEAKTLPADVCIFGHFGRLSPAADHSTDCRFVVEDLSFIHSHIFTQKLFFVELKQLQKSSTHCCFWSTVNKRGIRFDHSFLLKDLHAKWWIHCLLMPSTLLLSHDTSIYNRLKRVYGVFCVFRNNYRIWTTWAFIIIYVNTTRFKVRISPFNCFCLGRVLINIIKSLLCLNNIFPSESNALLTHLGFSIV